MAIKECFFTDVLVTSLLCSIGLCQSALLVVSPQGPIFASPGSTLSINCTVALPKPVVKWQHQLLNRDVTDLDPEKFKQDWTTPDTLTMTIEKVEIKDAGIYLCKSSSYGVQSVGVIVKLDGASEQCARTHYRCPDGRCIFQRYRCDYVTDCADGSDEKGCDRSCKGMFRCASGQCINKEYVCDKFHSFDCRDESDERDCGRIKYGVEVKEVVTGPTVEHHVHGWHFNAIYSGVASVIGVACVGAIIVITMCRIHMRRESLRRNTLYTGGGLHTSLMSPNPLLQSTQGRTSGSRLPWRRRSPHDQVLVPAADLQAMQSVQELAVLPHRCRGQPNVAVNINLQFSPEGVPMFARNIVKPPPYSELGPPLLDESPPPPYTTLPYSEILPAPQHCDTDSLDHTIQAVESSAETNTLCRYPSDNVPNSSDDFDTDLAKTETDEAADTQDSLLGTKTTP